MRRKHARFLGLVGITVSLCLGAFGASVLEGLVVGSALLFLSAFFPIKPTFWEFLAAAIKSLRKEMERNQQLKDFIGKTREQAGRTDEEETANPTPEDSVESFLKGVFDGTKRA